MTKEPKLIANDALKNGLPARIHEQRERRVDDVLKKGLPAGMSGVASGNKWGCQRE